MLNNCLSVSELKDEERVIILSNLLRYFQTKSSIAFYLSANISDEIGKLHNLNLEQLEKEISKLYEMTLDKTKEIKIKKLSDSKKLFLLREILEYFIIKIKLLLNLANDTHGQLQILLGIDPNKLNNELLKTLKIGVNDN